jgi:hypothetical protein
MITASFCDRVTNAMMEENTLENALFLQGVVHNAETMSGLATAASQVADAALQDTALWTLGIMMVSDKENIRAVAYDVARDNPIDAAKTVLMAADATVSMVRSAVYFVSGFLQSCTEDEARGMVYAVTVGALQWHSEARGRTEWVGMLYKFAERFSSIVPVIAVYRVLMASEADDFSNMLRSLENVCTHTERLGTALTRPEVMALFERISQYLDQDLRPRVRRDTLFAISNLVCEPRWADHFMDTTCFRKVMNSEGTKDLYIILGNLAKEMTCAANMELLRGSGAAERMLAVVDRYTELRPAIDRLLGLPVEEEVEAESDASSEASEDEADIPAAMDILHGRQVIGPVVRRLVELVAASDNYCAVIPEDAALTVTDIRQLYGLGFEITGAGAVRIAGFLR